MHKTLRRKKTHAKTTDPTTHAVPGLAGVRLRQARHTGGPSKHAGL